MVNNNQHQAPMADHLPTLVENGGNNPTSGLLAEIAGHYRSTNASLQPQMRDAALTSLSTTPTERTIHYREVNASVPFPAHKVTIVKDMLDLLVSGGNSLSGSASGNGDDNNNEKKPARATAKRDAEVEDENQKKKRAHSCNCNECFCNECGCGWSTAELAAPSRSVAASTKAQVKKEKDTREKEDLKRPPSLLGTVKCFDDSDSFVEVTPFPSYS